MAKTACSMEYSRHTMTLARAKSYIQERFEASLQHHWSSNETPQYKNLKIPMPKEPPPELALPRKNLGYLLAARSGHGDFAAYHRRWAHSDALLTCSCGRDKTPEHFFFCWKGRKAERLQTPNSCLGPQEAINWLLSTVEGAKTFSSWCSSSRFFDTIQRRH